MDCPNRGQAAGIGGQLTLNCRHRCRPPPAVQSYTAGCDASLTLSIPAHLKRFGTTGIYYGSKRSTYLF